MSVRAINFEKLDIGAHFKNLDQVMITIELVCSHLSGKKKVFKDGIQMYEVQKFGTSFQYPFQIGNHMLNIVQHGDVFELRIDNQSFTHLYHQDRTKRAFVYEGQEQQNEEETTNHYPNNTSNQNQQQDLGYGGYKKGHPDVNQNWQNTNNNYYNSRPQQKEDDFLWEDVKNAKNSSISTSNKQFQQQNTSQCDIRKKPYDDVLSISDSTFEKKGQNSNINNNKPKQFDFDAFGLPVNAKKAEYIQSQQQQNIDNLLDTEESKQKDDFFNFDHNFSNQPSQVQGSVFDFDFNQKTQSQTQKSNIDFDFNTNTQPTQFDFNAQANSQKASVFDLLENTTATKTSTLDDMLNVNFQTTNNNDLLKPETEQDRKIKDLLQTNFTTVQPSVIINNEDKSKSLEKENLEQKLVNLDDLMGSKSTKNQQYPPISQQFNNNNNIDPFAEAFQNSVKISPQQQPPLSNLNFLTTVPKPQVQQNTNDFFSGFQQQQQTTQQSNFNDFNFF